MAASGHARILPMKTAGTEHFIERTYREGGTYQWVRETLVNALEARATRIEFGVEWQAVENDGVYRRVVADNGQGMTGSELVEFFNTFGGGGKPIGGLHENFGVGAKTSLLPWNRYGLVVISWVEGEPSMIWVQYDSETAEYGLRLQETEDPDTGLFSIDEVYAPYGDDEHGCNWAAVKPEWITEHGTVVVFLGNEPTNDTVLGDPNRPEQDIKGISSYLNRRLWSIPNHVQITVDELRTQERLQWPDSETMAHTQEAPERRTSVRTIRGARHFIEYPVETFKGGRLSARGTVGLSDGTAVDWYLWDGPRPQVGSYAAGGGYIAAHYRNELYDVSLHPATFRSFGISESAVRSRVWLVVRPPEAIEGAKQFGVYPRTDRNALHILGGPNAGGPLPMNEWGSEFAERMPPEILAAIKLARANGEGTITDSTWRNRLADRFGSRWRIVRLRSRLGGPLSVDPTAPGTTPMRRVVRPVVRRRDRSGTAGGRGGDVNTGRLPGMEEAKSTSVAGAIPHYRKVGRDDVEIGMLAAWQPNDPEYPEGVVLLNVEHPVLVEQIEFFQRQYPDHYADAIAENVIAAYGEIAVAKVAHSEHLKGMHPSSVVENEFRSGAALTMSLLGLVSEEAMIAPRLGKLGVKRRAA
jgi:hypothetical protein